MRQRPSLLLLLSLSAVALFLLRLPSWPAVADPPSAAGITAAGPNAPAPGSLRGVASCAAMPCHGGNGPRGSWRSEYSTWIGQDPHSWAYEVLFNDRSKRIVKHLRLKDAPEEGRCLVCHVGPGWEQGLRPNAALALQDGVGCESCHGAADKWLSVHYRGGWSGKTPSEKEALGMRDTKTVAGRARVCVDCHVGAGDADVNHDLIAAGHPRLNFEFGAYHANLPRHWDDRKDKDPARGGRTDFEAEAWAVGQLVTAEAALELLQYRARAAAADPARHPWPEFAEYDCYACHHGLTARPARETPGWRQQRYAAPKQKKQGRYPGSLPWSDWYYAMTPRALEALDGAADPALRKALNNLRRALEVPLPKYAAVQADARAASDALARHLGRKAVPPLRPGELFRVTLVQDRHLLAEDWDAAAQFYLALAALHNAWSDQGRPPPLPPADLQPLLRDLAGALRSPEGFDPSALGNSAGALQRQVEGQR